MAVKKKTAAAAQAQVDDLRVAQQNWQSYVRGRDNGHIEYLKRADQYNEYYIGKQWTDRALQELQQSNRPAHTINLILSTVNAVLGEHLAARQEIILKPGSVDATPRTAELLTRVADNVQESNKSKWNETQVVSDGLIEERGFFDMRIDYSDNILGEVRETVHDNRDVVLDPGAKEWDPRTWSEVTTTRWWTPDEVAVTYGAEKAEKLRIIDRSTYSDFSDRFELETGTFADDDNKYLQGLAASGGEDDDWVRVKRVRLIDRQYYKLTERFFFVDPAYGDERAVPNVWGPEQREQFAKQWGLILYKRTVRAIRWTVSAGDVLLFDDWSPYKRFTIIPYFPYFRRGRPFGLITNLISTQDLLNKTASQELHVVNTTANSGWVFESGSLVNMTTEELRQVGAKTGLVLEFARGSTPPEKIQPNQIPSGLDRMTDKAGGWFREISGVSDAMLGQPGREISGVALDAKQQRGLVQLEVVFDNLAKTRQYRAEFMVELIQQFYTEQRLLRFATKDVDGNEQYENVTVNEWNAAAQEVVNDLTLGEYKVVVSSTPVRDNQDETTFAKLMQLRENGVLVPDYAIFEASNLPNRRELVEYAKKMAGMLEPSPEEVARQQALQEAELRMLMAQAAEAEAKASERLANVELLMAKAEAEGQKIPAEMQKMGAELRVEMDRMRQESKQHREELAARLLIAREKNAATVQVANTSAMVKRVEGAQAERAEQRQTAVAAAGLTIKAKESRANQAMEVVRMRHEARQSERDHEMKKEELQMKERVAKESAKAKAKTAAAKKPAAKRK